MACEWITSWTPSSSTDRPQFSGQMNPPGPPSQPGIISTQNAQGQQTWIPGTPQNPTLVFPGQSSPPPGAQQAMGGHMGIHQHNFSQGVQHNPGNAMPSPQPQPNQNNLLTPTSLFHNFAGTSVPPLDRARFQGSYRHFCQTKKLQLDEAELNIGGKHVDLHALHEEVLRLRASDRRVNFTLPSPSLCTQTHVIGYPEFLANYRIETWILLW